jgi:hypothetical protein
MWMRLLTNNILISIIWLNTFRYLHHALIILIRVVIAIIKCVYYPLSVYEVMTVLDYYLNLCAR